MLLTLLGGTTWSRQYEMTNHLHRDETPRTINTPEDENEKKTWHQKLLKSASGVLNRESSEPPAQCVVDNDGGFEAEADQEDNDSSCCQQLLQQDETPDSTSVSTSNMISLHRRILMALSLMLILHAMMANL